MLRITEDVRTAKCRTCERKGVRQIHFAALPLMYKNKINKIRARKFHTFTVRERCKVKTNSLKKICILICFLILYIDRKSIEYCPVCLPCRINRNYIDLFCRCRKVKGFNPRGNIAFADTQAETFALVVMFCIYTA